MDLTFLCQIQPGIKFNGTLSIQLQWYDHSQSDKMFSKTNEKCMLLNYFKYLHKKDWNIWYKDRCLNKLENKIKCEVFKYLRKFQATDKSFYSQI